MAEAPGGARKRDALWALALFSVVLLVFAPTLGFQFVNWDDAVHVLENPYVRAPHLLDAAFWITPRVGYSIAVPELSWWLNWRLGGFAPFGYHAGNVLLHALNTALVLRLCQRLGLGRAFAIGAALLFALHPLAAEPVSWVTGRKDLLAATFGLASLLVWLRRSPTWRSDAVANVLFALGALSQPSVFALPALVFLLRKPSRRSLAAVVPALALVATLVAASLLRATIAINPELNAPFPLRTFRTLGQSLRMVLPPFELSAVYVLPAARLTEPASWAGAAALLAFLIALARPSVRRSRAFPLLLLCGAAVAPVANVVPLLRELGDAHLYLPMAALAALFALAIERLASPLRPALRVALAIAPSLLCLPFLLQQCAVWQDGVTLWSVTYARQPDVAMVCRNLGVAHAEAHRPELALPIFERCARQFNRDFFLYDMVLAARDLHDQEKFQTLLLEFAHAHPGHPMVRGLQGKRD